MRRQRTAIFGTHHPGREPTLILTSWSLPDSAPHTSPGRPASCRTLAFGRLDENLRSTDRSGVGHCSPVAEPDLVLVVDPDPGIQFTSSGLRSKSIHGLRVLPSLQFVAALMVFSPRHLQATESNVVTSLCSADRPSCAANTPATGCARDRVKPHETCLLAALPRQESLTVSSTVLGSMSPPKVA